MWVNDLLSEIARLRMELDALDRDRLNMSEELVRLSEENAELRTALDNLTRAIDVQYPEGLRHGDEGNI